MIKTGKKHLLLFVLAAVLLIGCSRDSSKKEDLKTAEAAKTENLQEDSHGESGKENNGESGNAEDAAPAVSFEGQDLEGNVVSSDILASSKLTMINVWATYCNPCLREMPDLGELAGAYAPEEFQILGIISDVEEGAEQKMKDLASDLVTKTGASYTHLLLNESLYFALLTDVSAVPTTFFFDQEGNLLKTVVGSMNKAAWEEEINALLETQ